METSNFLILIDEENIFEHFNRRGNLPGRVQIQPKHVICQPSSQAILSTASYLINVLLHIPKSSKYLLGWIHLDLGLLRWRSCKELTCHCRKFKRHKFNPWKDPLKEEMETHSSILAWRIPWTEDPGGLWSIESQSWTQLKQHHACLYPDLILRVKYNYLIIVKLQHIQSTFCWFKG